MTQKNKLIIAIDFDGTITKSSGRFPETGKVRPEAIDFIRKWYSNGHTIIINSCRAKGEAEKKAKKFLSTYYIPYHYFNKNDVDNIRFHKKDTRKISADIYFDDRSTVVDWKKFDELVSMKEKPTVICIIGESGVGKTLCSDYIQSEYGIPLLTSYTTRGKRSDDEKCHVFLSNEEFDKIDQNSMTSLSIGNDGSRYCCLSSDICGKKTYVVSESSFLKFEEKYGKEVNILSVRLCRDISLRVGKISQERLDRDKGAFVLQKTTNNFSFVINNNSTKDFLFSCIDDFITENMLQ